MDLRELEKLITNLSLEELSEFREWFQHFCSRSLDDGSADYQPQTSIHDEVLVCLDELWNSVLIRRQYERRALKDAGMTNLKANVGWLPPRPSMLEAKRTFEKDLYPSIYEAIEQLDLLRGGKDLEELFRPSATVVFLGSGKYGVEIFIRRDEEPLLVKKFDDPHQARTWAMKKGEEYVTHHGVPSGTTLLLIG